MLLSDFYSEYKDEASCRTKIKELRESEGITCKKCGCKSHSWKKDKQMWECKSCSFRTSLRSGTVMENSKLPFHYWFTAIAYLSNTKKSISALELQRQLGHKRYEPIWAMLQKLRTIMGYRDSQYQLEEEIELDEGFFEAPSRSNRGKGYGKGGDKMKVLIAVESKYVDGDHKKNSKKVGFIKMKVIEKGGINNAIEEAEKILDTNCTVLTDDHKSYKKLPEIVKEHISIRCFNRKDSSEVLPWVHTTISNAKRLLLGIHHSISSEYLQNYLNEFCYKFNRRYFHDNLFDRMLIASISTNWYHNRYQSG